jgi:hypothetical protein
MGSEATTISTERIEHAGADFWVVRVHPKAVEIEETNWFAGILAITAPPE